MKEKKKRGRPRNADVDFSVLKAALYELEKSGFRHTTIDDIAARAKVSKMAIYRRWPNKASIIMDAFLQLIGPGTEFPQHKNPLERLRLQLIRQAKFFSGKDGQLVRTLIAEAQHDPELDIAFRERWLNPRRVMTEEVLKSAIEQNLLRSDLNMDTIIDAIYGPFYYRLMLRNAPLTASFAGKIFEQILSGLQVKK